MKKSIFNSLAAFDKVSWNLFLCEQQDVSDSRVQRIKKIIRIALENELTQRQRDCISMRYLENLPVKEIALRMSIEPTTVYKHLNKAVNTLKKCSRYL